MGSLKDLFFKKKIETSNYQEFWDWFKKNERSFYNVVKNKGDIERQFFNQLSPKLKKLRDGYFFLVGMLDTDTVELIITADGVIKNIVFVEDLVAAAPQISGWKFTALKPAMDIKNVSIQMGGYKFGGDNLSFHANNDPGYPDEIDITIVYHDSKEADKDRITNGVYIFLDNYLGELEFATIVDNLKVTSRDNAVAELVPIEKLKSFLDWRQKEFVEKYEGTRHGTENDGYVVLEASLKNGNPLIAVINSELLKWDAKASHPWILNIEIKFNDENRNGMPGKSDSALLQDIEDKLMLQLKDNEGFLNIGRQTADSNRNIYFACKDFRKAAKVADEISRSYQSLKMSYNVHKEKYWQSFRRFEND